MFDAADVIGVTSVVGTLILIYNTVETKRNGARTKQGNEHVAEQLETFNGHTVGELVAQNLPPSFGDQIATLNPRGDQNLPGTPVVDTTKPDGPKMTPSAPPEGQVVVPDARPGAQTTHLEVEE